MGHTTKTQKTIFKLGKSSGLVGKAEHSHLSGCGFKPGRRIMDGVSKAGYYIGKKK
jgi:hypothetical protein